tara:strand:- start:583 stop:1365 length:783 start_codon:yes stop_codon:yes gene_type:complete
MSTINHNDWGLSVAEGKISRYSVVNKFGHSDTIGTSFAPVAEGNVYQTPRTVQSLEILSSSTSDTSTGPGAKTMRVIGLGSDWRQQSEDVIMNGTTAVPLTKTWFRVYRLYMLTSGTYATAAAGTHVGAITLRGAGAGATWAVITATDFPKGQSTIAAYTVPLGYTAYMINQEVHVASTKAVDFLMFQRPDANQVDTPYSAMRVVNEHNSVSEQAGTMYKLPRGPFVGPCDIGMMAKVASGTGSASVEFELALYNSNTTL